MAFTTRQAASEERSVQQAAAKPSMQLFNDQRASTSAQLKQQQMMTSSQNAPLQRAEDEELLQGKFATAQLMEEEPLQGKFVAQRVEEEEPLQGKFATAQLMEEEEPIQGKFEPLQRAAEEEEPLQGKFESSAPAQREQKPNNTGMPDNLKSGIENLSGYAMDDVKVHYNSDKPAQLNAHAYAQGTDIHVAPGQEQHLPHEAWHVVQQKQGRVQPTMQMKAGVPVNDDAGLESEADVMGSKAAIGHPVQLFTDDGEMEKQTGSKIHAGVNSGRVEDNTKIEKVKLSRHHLVNKDSLMRFYNALVDNGHQAAVDAHVQTILGQLENMTDSDTKDGASDAWESAKNNKTPGHNWTKEAKKAEEINNKLIAKRNMPQSKNRDKDIAKLEVDLSGENIKIENKKNKILPKWNKFQDIFQWFPGNLVEGPASDLRTDDPGSNFDTNAHRTIGAPPEHQAAYTDIQTYIGASTLVNATAACTDLSTISTNFDQVHGYDHTKWELTPGQTEKYRVK
jgi:ribosomal protein L27